VPNRWIEWRPTGVRIRLLAVFVSTLAVLLLAASAPAVVVTPSVTGPITSPGSAFLTPPTGLDLASLGYVEQEFFVAGTATAYTSADPLGADGVWTATPGDTAGYVTRILVRRPTNPKKFNGTVVVEWLNVSGGVDAAPDWTFVHTMLLREGFAWVGVSAQLVGVSGTGGPLGLNLSLKAVNPVRYAPLVHPGDSFSYDMFSQVAQAIRRPSGTPPLGDLRVRRVLATGESQSAFRLVTYVDAVHPVARVYDGFLVHSRSGGAAPLSQAPQPAINAPTPSFIRTDLDVPVLLLETETDLITLGFLPARQPDDRHVRLWEIAGTAHDDAYGLAAGPDDPGPAALDTTYLPPVTSIFGVLMCDRPINAGPQHYVTSAAFWRLNRWARTGRARGASAPRLEIAPGTPAALARDGFGNALGGIRTPQVEVPIAALSGLGQSGGGFCALFGTTTPFDALTLATLYPSHAGYVAAVLDAARKAVHGGFILKADRPAIATAAMASNVGQ
jgi:hypothetical protein